MDHALRFASPDLHLEALHRHRQIQCLHPLHADPHLILSGQIIDLGLVFAPDRRDTLLLAPTRRIALREPNKATHGFPVKVVVIGMQPVLVTAQPSEQALDEWGKRCVQPKRKSTGHHIEHALAIPERREISARHRRIAVRRVEPRRDLVKHRVRKRAGSLVDPEPKHALALLV